MKVWTAAVVPVVMLAAAGGGTAMTATTGLLAGQERDRGDVSQLVHVLTGGTGQIGVSIRDVDEGDVKRAKLPAAGGVVVEDVRAESPAEKAGFKDGDVIVEFDGERVRSARQFTRLVQETPAERQVQAAVVRDGQRLTLTVQPESSDGLSAFRNWNRSGSVRVLPSPPTARVAPMPRDVFPHFEQYFFGSQGTLGITVSELSPQLGDYFGTTDGVLVTSVLDDSAAAKAGLKAGDVLKSLNGGAVTTPSDLRRRVQRLEDGDDFTLEVVRDKKPLTLKGTIERPKPIRWTSAAIG